MATTPTTLILVVILVDRDAHLEKTDESALLTSSFSCLSFTQSDLWSQQAPAGFTF
jgi:hypothetical protein